MQQLELISHALLWIVVIIEGVLLLALARQIGLLHQRLGSGGARIMNVGLTIGETVPIPNEIYDIDNQRFTLAIERGKRTLLLFISTTCSTCSSLMPQLKKLSHFERDNLEIKVVAFHSMVEAGRKYTIDHGLAEADIPLIVSDDLASSYKVGLAPYGMLIDRYGVLRSKGLVNAYQDIESLLNAEELRVRSIEQYVKSGRVKVIGHESSEPQTG